MTKKHFEAVAETFRLVLSKCQSPSAKRVLTDLAKAQAYTFSCINPRFNRPLFFEACGISD